MSINKRILELVNIKAGGNKSKFAKQIGWVPQHMTRITKEDGTTGLAVVEQILSTFKDVNARWLLFGEGEPITYRLELSNLVSKAINELDILQQKLKNLPDSEARRVQNCLNDFLNSLSQGQKFGEK